MLITVALFVPDADPRREASVFGDFSIFGALHQIDPPPTTSKSIAQTFVRMQDVASTPRTRLSDPCPASFPRESRVQSFSEEFKFTGEPRNIPNCVGESGINRNTNASLVHITLSGCVSHFRGVSIQPSWWIKSRLKSSMNSSFHRDGRINISAFKTCNKPPLFYFEEPKKHMDQNCCSAPVCRSLKSPKASASPCFPSSEPNNFNKCTQTLGSESSSTDLAAPSKPPHIQQLLSALS